MTNDQDGDSRPFEAEWDEEDRVLSGEAPHAAHATAERERDEARAALAAAQAELAVARASLTIAQAVIAAENAARNESKATLARLEAFVDGDENQHVDAASPIDPAMLEAIVGGDEDHPVDETASVPSDAAWSTLRSKWVGDRGFSELVIGGIRCVAGVDEEHRGRFFWCIKQPCSGISETLEDAYADTALALREIHDDISKEIGIAPPSRDLSELGEDFVSVVCERDEARAELNKLRAEMGELRAELASAREKAIKECEALAHDLSKSYEDRAKLPHAKGTALWSQRMTQACVASELADGIHALLACDGSPQEESMVCSNCDGDGLDPVTTSGDSVNDLDDDELCCSACGGTGVCGGWPAKDEKGQ